MFSGIQNQGGKYCIDHRNGVRNCPHCKKLVANNDQFCRFCNLDAKGHSYFEKSRYEATRVSYTSALVVPRYVAPRTVAPRAVAPRAASPPAAPRTVVADLVVPAVSTETRMDYFNCYKCTTCKETNADFKDTCGCGTSLSGVYLDKRTGGMPFRRTPKCPGCRANFKLMAAGIACDCGVGRLFVPMATWDQEMATRHNYLMNEYNSGDPDREMKAVLEASADEAMVGAARDRNVARSSAASARTSTPPVRSSPPALSSDMIACSVCTLIQSSANRTCELCSNDLCFI